MVLDRRSAADLREEREVTQAEHLTLQVDGSGTPSSPNRSGVARRLSSLMSKNPRQRKNTPPRVAHTRRQMDAISVGSDNATAQSVEGQQSLHSTTNHTVISNTDTVLVSNRTSKPFDPTEEEPKKPKRWSKIKRLIGGNRTAGEDGPFLEKARSKDDTWKSKPNNSTPVTDHRKRIHSADGKPLRVRSTPVAAPAETKQQRMLDQSILGRLDGLDVISLGPATLMSQPKTTSGEKAPWKTYSSHMFSGQPLQQTPAQMVADMLKNSSGRSPPEMVLEGFLPGGEDRWIVRFENTSVRPDIKASTSNQETDVLPSLKGLDMDECGTCSDDGSPLMPTKKLWNMLWGQDPAPTNLTDLEKINSQDDMDDPLLNLAAENSIPIDIDEETFIVSNREHLESIHDIAAGPLSNGRFDVALKIFDKLLKGVQMLEDPDLRFLKGSVLHNIGVIHLWEGNFVAALSKFREACSERSMYLPLNHPDTVVSMVRKGIAFFALERFDEAIEVWKAALPLVTEPDSVVRAKILNNLGAVHYQKGDFIAALKYFTSSLEVQRPWLDDSIRRQTNVYDATVTLGNMGKLYLEQPDYDLAYYVYEEALLLQTTIFRKDHDVVLASLTSLSLAKARNHQVTKALQILKGCLRSQNIRFGADSVASIETTGLLGYLYARQESYDEALKCLIKVNTWQSTRLQPSNPAMVENKVAVGILEELFDWV